MLLQQVKHNALDDESDKGNSLDDEPTSTNRLTLRQLKNNALDDESDKGNSLDDEPTSTNRLTLTSNLSSSPLSPNYGMLKQIVVEDFESFEHATNEVFRSLGTKCFGEFFECDTKKIQGKILATLILVVP